MTYRKLVWNDDRWYVAKVKDSGLETIVHSSIHWPTYKMD